MLFLCIQDVFVIKLSINSTPYFHRHIKNSDGVGPFTGFLKAYKEVYGELLQWSFVQEKERTKEWLEVVHSGLIENFILKNEIGKDALEKRMNEYPSRLTFDFDLDTTGGGNLENEVLWERMGAVSFAAKMRKIETAIVVPSSPEDIRKASSIGVDVIVFRPDPDLEPAESLAKLAHAARRTVDLGLRVGIGERLSIEELKLVLQKVPHIAEVHVGREFFAAALLKNFEEVLETYFQLLSDY